MNNTFGSGPRGNYRRNHGEDSGQAGFGIFDTFENLRTEFERRVVPRMGRGDVKVAVLALLAEEPMHGYQIIHEIEKRTDGAWKPSPGSVYPTLQLLADEGLVIAQEADGKKTYSLTDHGREEVKNSRPAPWETPMAHDSARSTVLPKAAAKLAEAVVQVVRSGNSSQTEEAVTVVNDARRALYAILAKE